jgi:dynein heavy chain 1, cytosolic
MGVNGPLFEIIRLRGGGSQLAVNFDPQVFTLFWKVKNLLWLNFQVPHTVSVIETLKAYGQTLDLVENNKGIEWLVVEYRNEVQRMVSGIER